jgi:hypothetical protein
LTYNWDQDRQFCQEKRGIDSLLRDAIGQLTVTGIYGRLIRVGDSLLAAGDGRRRAVRLKQSSQGPPKTLFLVSHSNHFQK